MALTVLRRIHGVDQTEEMKHMALTLVMTKYMAVTVLMINNPEEGREERGCGHSVVCLHPTNLVCMRMCSCVGNPHNTN